MEVTEAGAKAGWLLPQAFATGEVEASASTGQRRVGWARILCPRAKLARPAQAPPARRQATNQVAPPTSILRPENLARPSNGTIARFNRLPPVSSDP